MQVLHIHTDLVGGGIEKMITTLASHTKAGQVGICWCPANHPEPSGTVLREIAASGVTLHRIPPPFRSPLYPIRLARVIRKVRPDVLHLHGASIAVIGGLVGRMLRVPAVLCTEHMAHATHARWLRRLRERTCSLPHWTVFVSERSRKEAVTGGPLRSIEARCSVIHNGIDLVPYAQLVNEMKRKAIREELNLPPEAVLIGCVGLLWYAKGQEYLIRALGCLKASKRPLILLLVGRSVEGRDSEEEALCTYSEQIGVRENVRLIGWRADIPRILQALDLYVQPSLTEGLPLAVVEAAAAGLPIIATEVGGIPEIITHDHDGLLVPPGNSQALAEAIQRLIDNPDQARKLGENARRTAFERFSAEKMAQAYLELYKALLAGEQ
ncbi:MAG: glycosyltransferase [Candidatus Zipacnadales bacterium]